MKRRIYAIYDKVAQNYGMLFEAPNDQTAFRVCRNVKAMTEAPEEFRLNCFGQFDDETGQLEILPHPEEVYFTTPPKPEVNNG